MTSLVFISAHKDDLPPSVNVKQHEALGTYLRHEFGDGQVTEVQGAYKGVREQSWCVDVSPFSRPYNEIEKLETTAFLLRQDSILVVNVEQRSAVLHYTNDVDQIDCGENRTYLGRWTLTTRDYAETCDGFTYLDGQYWVVE